MTPSDLFHLIEGAGMLGLGTWIAWIQRRSAKVHDLEIRVVTLETEAKAQDKTLRDLHEGLLYVREHMLRREDVELLREALKS